MRASYTNHGCEGVTHLPVDDGHLHDVPRLVEHEVVVPGVAVLQTPGPKKRGPFYLQYKHPVLLDTFQNGLAGVPSTVERADDDLSSSKSEWGDDMLERKRLFVPEIWQL